MIHCDCVIRNIYLQLSFFRHINFINAMPSISRDIALHYCETYKAGLASVYIYMYLINIISYQVNRDLLPVEMGSIDDMHAGVAVIRAPKGRPVFRVLYEGSVELSVALLETR